MKNWLRKIEFNWLWDMKVGAKLLGSFLLMAAFVGVIGYFSLTSMSWMKDGEDTLFADALKPIITLNSAQSALASSKLGLSQILNANASDRASIVQQMSIDESLFNQSLEEYAKHKMSAGSKSALEAVKSNWQSFIEVRDKMVGLVRAGKKAEALALLNGQVKSKGDAIDLAFQQAAELTEADATKLDSEFDETYGRQSRLAMTLIITAVVVALAFGFFLTSLIARPLKQGVDMMLELSKGHLGRRLGISRKDEVGILAGAMDSFADSLQHRVVGVMKQISAGDLSAERFNKNRWPSFATAY